MNMDGVQPAVRDLVALGSWPQSEDAELELVDRVERLVLSIVRPVSDEDARELVKLFGPDDFFGLASTLVHSIETAPGWPLRDALIQTDNQWVEYLRRRSSI